MKIESIKLSSKRNGNGYLSGHSISISPKEAAECGLVGNRIIKIVDEESGQITIKAKHFTVTDEMVDTIATLIESVNQEDSSIDQRYFADENIVTMSEMLNYFISEKTNRAMHTEKTKLQDYLMSLSVENVADLTILMYLGRDMDADYSTHPGAERFLEYYDRYSYIVNGLPQETLVQTIMEKIPLIPYLRNGLRILFTPQGESTDELELETEHTAEQ